LGRSLWSTLTVKAEPLGEGPGRIFRRTVRVLVAVAANPGSSNRTIGDAADMSDQGQTSKLLARHKDSVWSRTLVSDTPVEGQTRGR
jgi:hypothetical protein